MSSTLPARLAHPAPRPARGPLLAALVPSAREPAGLVALALGLGALGLGVCALLPGWLSSPEVRELFPTAFLAAAGRNLAVLAALVGLFAVARERRPIGLVALALGLVGGLIARRGAPLAPAVDGEGLLGLDWLVVDGLVLTCVIVPLERLAPHRAGPLARAEWATDARYFLVNHLAVHALGLVAGVVAATSLGWAHARTAASGLAALPIPLQVVLLLLVTDLVQYWLHRASHEVPWLWRIHAVHHSSRHLDALAGSRIHLLETLGMRTAIFCTFYALGLPFESFLGYAGLIALQGTFIHSNVALRYGWLERVLVSPRYHHWHHASDAEAIDTNYAGTFPFLDRLFGTHHLPADRWPARYGTVKERVPATLLAQQRFPFTREPAAGAERAA